MNTSTPPTHDPNRFLVSSDAAHIHPITRMKFMFATDPPRGADDPGGIQTPSHLILAWYRVFSFDQLVLDVWNAVRGDDNVMLPAHFYVSSSQDQRLYARWIGPRGEVVPPSLHDRAIANNKCTHDAWWAGANYDHGAMMRIIGGIRY